MMDAQFIKDAREAWQERHAQRRNKNPLRARSAARGLGITLTAKSQERFLR
jgi:hypothetical protein